MNVIMDPAVIADVTVAIVSVATKFDEVSLDHSQSGNIARDKSSTTTHQPRRIQEDHSRLLVSR